MKKGLFVLVGILIFSNCSKYEEGPFLTLLSKERRLVRTWISQELLFDYENNDTRVQYLDNFYCDSAINGYTKTKIKKEFTFRSGGELDYIEYAEFSMLNPLKAQECKREEVMLSVDTLHFSGSWRFIKNKQMIKIMIDSLPARCDSCDEWQIVKLSTSELKLRQEDFSYTPTEENYTAK